LNENGAPHFSQDVSMGTPKSYHRSAFREAVRAMLTQELDLPRLRRGEHPRQAAEREYRGRRRARWLSGVRAVRTAGDVSTTGDAMTRDSLLWWFLMVAGVVSAVAGHLDLFPWLSPQQQHYLELAGFIAATVSGKLGMSPLPLSDDGKAQIRAEQAKAGQV
jgi:hypothetical protein